MMYDTIMITHIKLTPCDKSIVNENVLDLTQLQILILVAFVMISGGSALHTSSMLITLNRLNITPTGLGIPKDIQRFTSNIDGMFAGMFMEVLFLVRLKMNVWVAHMHMHTCMHKYIQACIQAHMHEHI